MINERSFTVFTMTTLDSDMTFIDQKWPTTSP